MEIDDALLSDIARALGEPTPYPRVIGDPEDEDQASSEVLGGATDPESGLVGWIERNAEAAVGGHVPVEIDVCFAGAGELRRMELPTYNPYFGCRVHAARWSGDSLVVVYSEKHRTIVGRFHPSSEEPALVAVGSSILCANECVWATDGEGVMLGVRCTTLQTSLPVLVPRWSRRWQVLLPSDDEGTLLVAPKDQGSAAHHEAVRIALPPFDAVVDRVALRDRWGAYLLREGADADVSTRIVDVVGAPWLAIAEPASTYHALPRPSSNVPRSPAVRRWLRAKFRALPVEHGWPAAASVDDALDTIFRSALAQAAQRD